MWRNLISDFWCTAKGEREINSFRSCSFPIPFLHSKFLCEGLNYTFQTHVLSCQSVQYLLSKLISHFWCSAQEEGQIHSFSSCSFLTRFLHSKLLCKGVNYTFQTHFSSCQSVEYLLSNSISDFWCIAQGGGRFTHLVLAHFSFVFHTLNCSVKVEIIPFRPMFHLVTPLSTCWAIQFRTFDA